MLTVVVSHREYFDIDFAEECFILGRRASIAFLFASHTRLLDPLNTRPISPRLTLATPMTLTSRFNTSMPRMNWTPFVGPRDVGFKV